MLERRARGARQEGLRALPLARPRGVARLIPSPEFFSRLQVEAAKLGYADQGHFIRDFKSMFGEPPTWYAQRY